MSHQVIFKIEKLIITMTNTNSGEGHTVVIRGANDELDINDITLARDHLENSKLLLCTFSPSLPAIYSAMQMAKEKNSKI